jgi:hypothetical protein
VGKPLRHRALRASRFTLLKTVVALHTDVSAPAPRFTLLKTVVAPHTHVGKPLRHSALRSPAIHSAEDRTPTWANRCVIARNSQVLCTAT